MSFVRAVNTEAIRPAAYFVPLDDAMAAPASDAGPRAPSAPAIDILDSEFVRFHAELKEYMTTAHGLLGKSEAFALHETVCECISFPDTPPGDDILI